MDKRYDNKQFEPQQQQKWQKKKTYDPHTGSGELYRIDTPPPTVSGALHIGHVFSYTQTDIVARHKRMSGYRVFYPFGFDDNGLPTERYVEKKNKVSAHSTSRSEFIKLCLKETKAIEHEFIGLWQALGLSADFAQSYSTISETSRKISQESFIRLFNDNHIYRKNEPALYCTSCRTSVAQAELDDKEEQTLFSDIVFTDEAGKQLVISTTRPELLPSCVALFYHPQDARYQKLAGKKAVVPIFNYQVPILADELVDPEKGSGLVMCCTFGDKNDITWYKKHNLSYKQSVGKNGRWIESTGPLAGLKFAKARKKILELLQADNKLHAQKKIVHAVNIHERCKKEIEYIALPQWYVKILPLKDELIALADKINWYPAFMKTRYINWVENLGWDWGISRQRFYGIPFPVWHCQACGHSITAAIDELPVDPQETPYNKPCPSCGSTDIVPDTDIMDTWNTSSLTPQICMHLYTGNTNDIFDAKKALEFIPMSMRPQAHDIIRTWAFYTIVKSWLHYQTIPWKEIVISGHVLSSAKEKLSKSKENSKVSPQALLQQYPADAIRYWTASANLGYDTAFSEEQIKIGVKLITKLWNAFRFCQPHLGAITAYDPHACTGIVNEWLVTQASDCYQQYENYFAKHEFGLALQTVEKFFWHDFCDNYLELIKHQLFNPEEYSPQQVTATQNTLFVVGLRLLQLYAPYLPHLTETVYELIYQEKIGINSIHLTPFANFQVPVRHASSVSYTKQVLTIVSQIRRLKTESQLSLKTELHKLTLHCTQETEAALRPVEQLLQGVTQAKEIAYQRDTIMPYLEQKEERYWAGVTVE